MNRSTLFSLVAVLVFWPTSASAYEVWMGTLLMRGAGAQEITVSLTGPINATELFVRVVAH